MKQMTPPLRLRVLVLGMLMAITGCHSGLKPVEIVGASPTDDPELRERAATASPAPADGSAPAFPGAEGFGANSVGGRGGRVIEVTNLNDSGPGSLRAAIEAEGPRIVVFRVAGIIEINGGIRIRNSYLTIAGQTAPGGGITIKGSNGNALRIYDGDGVHDVTIRYLRLRYGQESGSDDNITIHGGHDIIIDHVSMSWSTDENAGVWRANNRPPIYNITFQRSIMAEGLAGHSNGMHISGEKDYSLDPPVEAWRQVRDLTVHHNLFIHNTHRNPRVISAGTQVINNVVYNWKYRIGSTMSGSVIDYINNYYKGGPMSNLDDLLLHEDFSPNHPEWQTPLPDPSIYIAGNIVQPNHPDPNADNWVLLEYNYYHTPLPERFRRLMPLPQAPIPVSQQSASGAYDSVVTDIGANARLDCLGNWVPNADSVDLRLLADVENGTGPEEPISDSDEVGGFPEIDPGTPCTDSDHDGMPDEWENLHGFNPNDSSDGPEDADGDGYTNVEEYLNGTEPRGGVPLPTPTPTPQSTLTPIPTSTPTPTNTPNPTATSTPLPTSTPTLAPTNTPTPTSTPQPTSSPTPVPPTPTPTPSPTPTPTPGDLEVYEAEEATLTDAAAESNHSGFTGSGFVNYLADSGANIRWMDVNVSSSGDYTLTFRYALGKADRPIRIEVNGSVVKSSLNFPNTGGWSNWTSLSINAPLNSGSNTIKAVTIGYDGPNIDHLEVQPSEGPSVQNQIFLPFVSKSSFP